MATLLIVSLEKPMNSAGVTCPVVFVTTGSSAPARIVVQPDVRGHHALARKRSGGQVIKAPRRRDRLLDGRGDEAAHQLRRGAGVDGGDGDDGAVDPRKLTYGQFEKRAHARE